jgi:hypothetical protein
MGTTAGARAGLDVLLTDAVVGNGSRRFIQPRAIAAIASGMARRPRSVADLCVGDKRPANRSDAAANDSGGGRS